MHTETTNPPASAMERPTGAACSIALGYLYAFAVLIALAGLVPRGMAPGTVLLGVLFWSVCWYVQGKPVPLHKQALGWALGLLAIAGMSIIWALNKPEALERWGKLVGFALPAVLLVSVSLHMVITPLRSRIWLIPAALALAALFMGLDDLLGYRIYATLHHAPDISQHLYKLKWSMTCIACLLFPALAGLRLVLKGTTRWYACALLTLLVFAVTLMGETESAYCAIVLGLVAMLLPLNAVILWRMMRVAYVSSLFIMPWLGQWGFSYAAAIRHAPVIGTGAGHGAARLEIYDAVGRYILKSPILGYGLESSPYIKDFGIAMRFYSDTRILHPHNFALQLWLELGLAGILFGAAFGWYLLCRIQAFTSPAIRRCALASFAALYFIAFTSYGIWQSWLMGLMVLIMAMLLLQERIARDMQANPLNL